MKISAICGAAALLAGGVTAQVRMTTPLEPFGFEAGLGGVVVRPHPEQFALLTGLQHVVLEDVVLPGGERVDLELARIDLAKRRFGYRVDGERRPDLLEGLDLSLWEGAVVGEPGSSVMLSFSTAGSRGWVRRASELVHFLPRPGRDGDWRTGDVLLVTERDLNRRGYVLEFECGMDELIADGGPPPAPPAARDAPQPGSSGCLLECRVSVETDYQLFQVFGDLGAMTAYVTTLLGFVSARYEEQIETVLTYPYLQFYTSSGDPWSAQDGGGGCGDVLNEFRDAWAGSIPAGGQLGHFLSGADLGCGVAWLDVLCSTEFNFSVSGNINGQVQFPVAQRPNNWDFMVVAHEIGHNFGTPHTHDYCPPLDECPSSSYWGSCQDEQICITNGTNMSYCHLCPGGTANITTYFHPTAAGVMQAGAQSCLPELFALDGDSPDILSELGPTTVAAQVLGTPVAGVQLHYRYDGGSYTTVAMSDLGGGTWEGVLPTPTCDDSPEFYYSFDDSTCGPVADPPDAPTTVYSALVGTATTRVADDFESDQGWGAEVLGASSGDWQRGVPVDDPGWDYDPAADHDGSGSAYLTQNEVGNTDVDDGAVRLTSPTIDMTGGPVLIRYAYYLRLTNEDGTDRLLVEISEDGGAPWTEIARHDTNGGLGWRTHAITAEDLTAAGVTPTATMQLRFTANDGDAQSIVEAGVDAFEVLVIDCDDGIIGTNYCISTPNSTGEAAVMTAAGSASIAANDLELIAEHVPVAQFGIFYYGAGQLEIPFGNGFRCVGAGGIGIFRLPVTLSQAPGTLRWLVDNALPPSPAGQLTAGATWNFQGWFRDPPAGGAFFDLSDGYSITFVP